MAHKTLLQDLAFSNNKYLLFPFLWFRNLGVAQLAACGSMSFTAFVVKLSGRISKGGGKRAEGWSPTPTHRAVGQRHRLLGMCASPEGGSPHGSCFLQCVRESPNSEVSPPYSRISRLTSVTCVLPYLLEWVTKSSPRSREEQGYGTAYPWVLSSAHGFWCSFENIFSAYTYPKGWWRLKVIHLNLNWKMVPQDNRALLVKEKLPTALVSKWC